LERLVKFEVLGQEYPLYTDAPEEDVEEILNLVKSQIEDHSKTTRNTLPANKIAVLTSLNMAGKYVRLKRDFEKYKNETDQAVSRLTEKIANSLAVPNESANR
jgi:cell division protein ZapA (FtsZ GTPase activity inhibitor)